MYVYSFTIRSAWRHTHHSPPSALNILPYPNASYWDPLSVCLAGTRVALLEDIWKWIQAADYTKPGEILWLTLPELERLR